MEVFTITVPACLKLSKTGKNYYLNLNQFRNWHYIVNDNLKKKFSKDVGKLLGLAPKLKTIEVLQYKLISPDKRKRDRMNVYAIVDKFFCDTLQHEGVIKDDSDGFIKEFRFLQSEYKKGKPHDIRCEVSIFYKK